MLVRCWPEIRRSVSLGWYLGGRQCQQDWKVTWLGRDDARWIVYGKGRGT
jgi:hypothetical protein